MDKELMEQITSFDITKLYRKDCKPCPFCGVSAVILVGNDEETSCECNYCGASTCGRKTEEEAISQWNWRADEKS